MRKALKVYGRFLDWAEIVECIVEAFVNCRHFSLSIMFCSSGSISARRIQNCVLQTAPEKKMNDHYGIGIHITKQSS